MPTKPKNKKTDFKLVLKVLKKRIKALEPDYAGQDYRHDIKEIIYLIKDLEKLNPIK